MMAADYLFTVNNCEVLPPAEEENRLSIIGE
jgi:hypothetical protein